MLRILSSRSVVVASLVVLMITVASAQQRGQGGEGARFGGPPSMGKVGLVRGLPVQWELKLDDDQKAKIREIAARLHEARGEQPGADTDRQQYRERMQAFNRMVAEEEKKLDEVLKEDQQKRLNEIALQSAGILGLFREDIASKLELSNEQKERLQALLLQQREQAQRGDVARSKEQFQLWEQQLTAVLSEDQKKKWEELKGEPFQMMASRGGRGRADGQQRRPQN